MDADIVKYILGLLRRSKHFHVSTPRAAAILLLLAAMLYIFLTT
jgi:hypothetical protein